MGCDIHLRVERKRDSGHWVDVAPPETWSEDSLQEDPEHKRRTYEHWFSDRNYELFAALAGVRNSGHIIPLFAPRGLPEDVATKNDPDGEGGWFGDHSHSWVTLDELEPLRAMAIPYTGVVDVETYDAWKASGELCPESWCTSVGGAGVVVCDENQLFMSRGEGHFSIMPKATHVRARWVARGERAFERFLRFTDYLKRYGKPEDVRLVFGFDS